MGATTIEWLRTYQADGTFTQGWSVNPIKARDRETGAVGHYCELCSPGCGNCYASRFQPRFGLPMFAGPKQREERLARLELFLDEAVLAAVVRRKKPTRIFWEDMSDLFGAWVPPTWILRCLAAMLDSPQHIHLVLTKRPDRMRTILFAAAELADKGAELIEQALWGVTICNQAEADRWQPVMEELATAGWPTWVSYEPALGPVDWTGWEFLKQIVGGGESGNGPSVHPSHPDWHRATRDFCVPRGIPYFFKQWGEWAPEPMRPTGTHMHALWIDRHGLKFSVGDRECASPACMRRVGKKAAGRLLDGREWNEFPATGSSSLAGEAHA